MFNSDPKTLIFLLSKNVLPISKTIKPMFKLSIVGPKQNEI